MDHAYRAILGRCKWQQKTKTKNGTVIPFLVFGFHLLSFQVESENKNPKKTRFPVFFSYFRIYRSKWREENKNRKLTK